MGIYIPGMEMPKSCSVCRLFGEYGCPFIGAVGYALTRRERSEDCPLVPVPAHGRLVDADDFSEEMKKRQDAAWEWRGDAKDEMTAARADAVLSFLSEVKLTLDKLPTVIPKEEA